MSIKIDVLTTLDRTSTREAAREAQQYFADAGPNAGDGFMDGLSRAIGAKSPEVEKALRKVTDASGKVLVEQEKLNDLQAKGTATRAQLVVQSERLAKAFREEETSLRDANRVLSDHDSALRKAEQSAQSFQVSTNSAASSMAEFGTQLRGMSAAAQPSLIAAMGVAVSDLAAVSASAAQSLIALPAVIGSVAVGIGTLKLATAGFSDALGAMRDPEKFSEALKSLSPNAQQAANSIRGLLPEFDQLKNATQDALFNGIGPQLTALTNQFLPTIQQLTTGVAGAFNSMLGGLSTQLMTPETMASIQTFANNVTQSFQALAPAVAPVTKAFTDLMAVGSTSLPQFATAAAQAAQAFSAFITNNSNSGQLQQWLSQGLNTVTQLGGAVWRVVEAFGSLAPTGRQVLPSIVNALNETAKILPAIVQLAGDATRNFQNWSQPLAAIAPIVKGISWAFEQMNKPISDINVSLGNLISPLHAIADLVDGIRWFFDPAGRDDARSRANQALTDAQAQASGIPGFHGGGVPGYQGGSGSFAAPGPAGLGPAAPAWVAGPAAIGGLAGGAGSARTTAPTPWTPASIPTSTGGGGGAPKGHVEDTHGALVPNAVNLENIIKQVFPQVQSIGGYRAPDGFNEHSSGEALDIMVGTNKALGDQVNQFLLQNASALGIQYDLWQQTQWDPNGTMTPMHDRGSPTANHRDHVHARVKPGDPASGNYMDPGMSQYKMGPNGPQPVNVEQFGSSATASLQGIFAPMDSDLGISGGLPGIAKYFTSLLGNMALAGAIGSSPTLQAAAFGPGGISPIGGGGGYGYGPSAMGPTPIGGGLGAPLVGAFGSPAAGIGFGPAPGPSGTPGISAQGNPTGAGPLGGSPVPWQPSTQGFGGPSPAFGFGGGGATPGASNPQSMQPAGGGGGGGGGVSVDAAGLAGGAASMIPGAQQGLKLASRAIQFGAQAASIGVSGLMETFLPHDSALAGNSWVSKIAGGLSGAGAAKPNQAGQAAPPTPQGNDHMPGQVHNGPMVQIDNMTTGHDDGQGVANDIARNQYSMYQAGQGR